jgi:hypothetical protein
MAAGWRMGFARAPSFCHPALRLCNAVCAFGRLLCAALSGGEGSTQQMVILSPVLCPL